MGSATRRRRRASSSASRAGLSRVHAAQPVVGRTARSPRPRRARGIRLWCSHPNVPVNRAAACSVEAGTMRAAGRPLSAPTSRPPADSRAAEDALHATDAAAALQRCAVRARPSLRRAARAVAADDGASCAQHADRTRRRRCAANQGATHGPGRRGQSPRASAPTDRSPTFRTRERTAPVRLSGYLSRRRARCSAAIRSRPAGPDQSEATAPPVRQRASQRPGSELTQSRAGLGRRADGSAGLDGPSRCGPRRPHPGEVIRLDCLSTPKFGTKVRFVSRRRPGNPRPFGRRCRAMVCERRTGARTCT